MSASASSTERLARSLGELRHTVAALQAKTRSQEVILTDLGQRLCPGRGLSGLASAGYTTPPENEVAGSTARGDRLRQVEAALASLKEQVEHVEASAAKACAEVVEIREAKVASETCFLGALRSHEADVRQRVEDLQKKMDQQTRALDAALFGNRQDRLLEPRIRHGRCLEEVSHGLDRRVADLEVTLACHRQSSEENLSRLRSDVIRTMKLSKVEGARLEGALEAKLEELDLLTQRSSASGQPEAASSWIADRKILDQAIQAASSRTVGQLDGSLRILGERQRNLDVQVSSITAGLRACGEEQERLAREAAVRNDQVERQLAECCSSAAVSEVRAKLNESLANVGPRLTCLDAARDRCSQAQEEQHRLLAELSTRSERVEALQKASELRHDEALEALAAEQKSYAKAQAIEDQSNLIQSLRKEMDQQVAEASRFEAHAQGEISEVLLQVKNASESAAAAGSLATKGQATTHRLRDEEAEFREHLASAVGSLRAELVDRNAMIEDRLARTQGRVAQELGEQRARTDSRISVIEEQLAPGSRAEHLTRQVEELSRAAVMREFQVLRGELNRTADHRFDCTLRCLRALYSKVGLNPRETLGDILDSPRNQEEPQATEAAMPGPAWPDEEGVPGDDRPTPRSARGTVTHPRLGSPGGPGGAPASPQPSGKKSSTPPAAPSLRVRERPASSTR
mmetsp:Transcript_67937/g.119920  ORF Transcript_67937/g.119920 Transcript_67937/m.119920 type:complete len:689 (+) Transcript_67937:79-2145(+)